MVKSLNLVPLIRVPIRIDILGRFLNFQSFRASFTIPQLTFKFCYILIIFALREDLICHFSLTYCVRYQGDRVLFTAFLPLSLLLGRGHSIVKLSILRQHTKGNMLHGFFVANKGLCIFSIFTEKLELDKYHAFCSAMNIIHFNVL